MTASEIVFALIGPLTAGAWFIATHFNDKHTRSLIGEEVGRIIDVKLAAFRDTLNGQRGFRRTESCDLMMKPLTERVDAVEGDLRDLHGYAHNSRRALANEVMRLQSRMENLHSEGD
jgi:hypothetical protein